MSKTRVPAARKPPAEMPLRVEKHIKGLRLHDRGAYLAWCQASGFKASVSKTLDELEVERHAFAVQRLQRDSQLRRHKNPRQIVELACAGKISPDEIGHLLWKVVCDRIANSDPSTAARHSLCRLLARVYEAADFLAERVLIGGLDHTYIDGLIALNDRRGQWIRPLESWKLESHNHRKQFASLTRHLLATYPVPVFLDSVWLRRDRAASCMRDWFIHIGSGQNIRSARTPVPMTRMIAHHFLQAPDHYSVENAIRWGQVHALGGGIRLTEALLATPLGTSFEHEDFWVTVIRFFVANPMLDRAHVGPIVDYLQHQKFEMQEVFIGDRRQRRQPAQPNLSMAGRSAASLLAQVERWHRGLRRIGGLVEWPRSGIGGFELETGQESKNLRVWRIRELLSSADLLAEGRAMRHCVASYAGSCKSGRCSIWSMEVHSKEGIEKRQTVEVTNNRVIVQSRGKNNTLPTQQEFQMLQRWVAHAGLQLSTYVKPGS